MKYSLKKLSINEMQVLIPKQNSSEYVLCPNIVLYFWKNLN
jgi:hypothetical protein